MILTIQAKPLLPDRTAITNFSSLWAFMRKVDDNFPCNVSVECNGAEVASDRISSHRDIIALANHVTKLSIEDPGWTDNVPDIPIEKHTERLPEGWQWNFLFGPTVGFRVIWEASAVRFLGSYRNVHISDEVGNVHVFLCDESVAKGASASVVTDALLGNINSGMFTTRWMMFSLPSMEGVPCDFQILNGARFDALKDGVP